MALRPTTTVSGLFLLVLGLPVAALAQVAAPAAAVPTSLGLGDLEQMALRGNPTLQQAAAEVEPARVRALPGNCVEQVIVTASQLRLNRARCEPEVAQAVYEAATQQYRVVNRVRLRYYRTLALQRLLEEYSVALGLAEQVSRSLQEQVARNKAERADYLEARLEVWRVRRERQQAVAHLATEWRELAALVGQPGLPMASLQGELDQLPPPLCRDTLLAHLLERSPEMLVARAELDHQHATLARERLERLPNVQLTAGTENDFQSLPQVGLADVGVHRLLFERNHDNLGAAQAGLTRVELSLRQRLAEAFEEYQSQHEDVMELRDEVLPAAREVYQLRREGLENGKGKWCDVKEAQKAYFRLGKDYVQDWLRLRCTEVVLTGLLLRDGLDEPSPQPGQGPPRQRSEPRLLGDQD